MRQSTCASSPSPLVDHAVVSAKLEKVSMVPEHMKALILEEPGLMSLRQVPVPKPKKGEILVQVKAATTCGTDLKAFRRGHPQIPMPGVFGHEYSGIVVAVGDDAPFGIGQHVMGVHSAPCLDCYWCNRGQENLCESIMDTKVLGSFAEYLLIPAQIAKLNVFEKPDSLPFATAALLEPFSCVAQAIQEMRLALGTPKGLHEDLSVLVIGPGAIGLLFVAALKMIGVENVVLAGRNEQRLRVGRVFGAETVHVDDLKPRTEPGFDVVIECTGQVEVWEKSIQFVRRGGSLVLFGGCPSGSKVQFDTARIHYDQISVLSPFHFGTQAVKQARTWLLDAKVNFEELLTGARTLEEADQTFADLQNGRGIKFVFCP